MSKEEFTYETTMMFDTQHDFMHVSKRSSAVTPDQMIGIMGACLSPDAGKQYKKLCCTGTSPKSDDATKTLIRSGGLRGFDKQLDFPRIDLNDPTACSVFITDLFGNFNVPGGRDYTVHFNANANNTIHVFCDAGATGTELDKIIKVAGSGEGSTTYTNIVHACTSATACDSFGLKLSPAFYRDIVYCPTDDVFSTATVFGTKLMTSSVPFSAAGPKHPGNIKVEYGPGKGEVIPIVNDPTSVSNLITQILSNPGDCPYIKSRFDIKRAADSDQILKCYQWKTANPTIPYVFMTFDVICGYVAAHFYGMNTILRTKNADKYTFFLWTERQPLPTIGVNFYDNTRHFPYQTTSGGMTLKSNKSKRLIGGNDDDTAESLLANGIYVPDTLLSDSDDKRLIIMNMLEKVNSNLKEILYETYHIIPALGSINNINKLISINPHLALEYINNFNGAFHTKGFQLPADPTQIQAALTQVAQAVIQLKSSEDTCCSALRDMIPSQGLPEVYNQYFGSSVELIKLISYYIQGRRSFFDLPRGIDYNSLLHLLTIDGEIVEQGHRIPAKDSPGMVMMVLSIMYEFIVNSNDMINSPIFIYLFDIVNEAGLAQPFFFKKFGNRIMNLVDASSSTMFATLFTALRVIVSSLTPGISIPPNVLNQSIAGGKRKTLKRRRNRKTTRKNKK